MGKNKEKIFTTNQVDDDYFMGSDLHIRNGVHKKTLEFHHEGQRTDCTFTLYEEGIKELHQFLTKWLQENE